MIQINLLPGSAKKQRQRLPLAGGGLARLKLPKFDRMVGYMALAWVVGLGLTGYLYFSSAAKLHQLDVDVQAAQRDSTRLHRLYVLNDSLKKQIDEIGARVAILQEIDAGRYVWPHILDEIARALAPYTWLVNLTDTGTEGGATTFKLEGRTGNTFALAKFMQDLEASPFLQNVTLVSQTVAPATREDDRVVYAFILEVTYEEPPPDAIQTQPLFTMTGESDLTDSAAADSTQPAREGN